MHFNDGIITFTDTNNPEEEYEEFATAVLDGHIPLPMAIGLRPRSLFGNGGASVIERHPDFKEMLPEIAKNLRTLIFKPIRDVDGGFLPFPEVVTISAGPDSEGSEYLKVTTSTGIITSNNKPLEVIGGEQYLFSCTADVQLHLFVKAQGGVCDMEHNSNMLHYCDNPMVKVEEYFTPHTMHTLGGFLWLPPHVRGSNDYRYKVRLGMTDEDVQLLWDYYLFKKGSDA